MVQMAHALTSGKILGTKSLAFAGVVGGGRKQQEFPLSDDKCPTTRITHARVLVVRGRTLMQAVRVSALRITPQTPRNENSFSESLTYARYG